MNDENCVSLNGELGFFQNLLLDILTRRVVFRKFEAELKKTNLTEYNDMVWFVWHGYVISQLSDCRKFFDRDGHAHSFQFVVKHLKDKPTKNRHIELFEKWKSEKLEAIINKYMLHADQGNSEMKTEVHLITLDAFINDLEKYLKEIVNDLNKSYQNIGSPNNSSFLAERGREVDTFFEEVRKKSASAD
jgi:hypothetical protein